MPGYKLIVKNAKVILKTVTNAVLNISGIKDLLTGTGSVDSNNKINWTLQEYTNTAANFTSINPVLLLGQKGIETDGLLTAPKFKIGDGVTAWDSLPYANSSGVGSTLGLIKIVDLNGDFFTDLATASAYIEQYFNPSIITDKSFNNGVFYFTVPNSTSTENVAVGFLSAADGISTNSASFVDEFGLVNLFSSASNFERNSGYHIMGNVDFQLGDFNEFSGIAQIQNIIGISAALNNFGLNSTGKFIIEGNLGSTESANFGATFFSGSTATIFANASKYTSNAGGIQGDLVTAITNGCNVFFDGIDKEKVSNKSTSIVTDQASSIKYPSVKSVYDWATGLFATISSLASYVTLTGTQTLTNKTLDSPIITVGAINVSPTELSYLDGVTSSIQTQLNNKGSSTPVYSTKWLTAPFATLPNSIGNFAGAIFYIPISVSKTMTLTDLRMEVTNGVAASNIRLAIYNDNNGAPSTLLDQSTAISSAVIGQKDYTLVSPITIQASDQKFWLAVQASVNGVGLRSSTSGVCLNLLAGSGGTGVMSYEIQAFGAFPATSTPTLNPSQQVILMAAKLQ